MQTIEQLNNSLLKLYEDVLKDRISLRKAMVAANVANTLLRGIVVQTQMVLPQETTAQRQLDDFKRPLT